MLELNKLYNMDCMQGMKEFPDGFFDLFDLLEQEERKAQATLFTK